VRKPGKLLSASVIAVAASGRYRFVPGGIDPNVDTLLLEGDDTTSGTASSVQRINDYSMEIPTFDTSRKVAYVPSAGCATDVIGAVAS